MPETSTCGQHIFHNTEAMGLQVVEVLMANACCFRPKIVSTPVEIGFSIGKVTSRRCLARNKIVN